MQAASPWPVRQDVKSVRCCALIPYFEAGDALLSSIDSIGESPRVDVLVVDDGSRTWPARDALSGYSGSLEVRLIELPENRGIAHALNAGLAEIVDRYDFVARLDCGDTCVNDRIRRQIDYLDNNPDCWLVGSWVECVSREGCHLYELRHPTTPEEIRRRMFVNSAFSHPAVMFRSTLITELGNYPTNRPFAEDFSFFRAVVRHHQGANLPCVMVRYVIDAQAVSTRRRRRQLLSRLRVLLDNFEPKGIAFYGLLRTCLQLLMPRSVTVQLYQWRQRAWR
ncbi:MAG TPA: glycosyltransferase [Nocardioidaceae bacterium]|nr:glycosyltransferase [Nocardioidaceae bacterium]